MVDFLFIKILLKRNRIARFRGKRVRLLLGKRDVQIWMNTKPVRVTPSPETLALAFTPRGMRELPNGTGPCL